MGKDAEVVSEITRNARPPAEEVLTAMQARCQTADDCRAVAVELMALADDIYNTGDLAGFENFWIIRDNSREAKIEEIRERICRRFYARQLKVLTP